MGADSMLVSHVALLQDVVRDGNYNISRICGAFGLRPTQFAGLTDRQVESVAKPVAKDSFMRPDHAKTIKVLKELVQLLGLLRSMGVDAGTWFQAPLASYDGHSPLELVRAGKGQELVTRLLGLASGDVGG